MTKNFLYYKLGVLNGPREEINEMKARTARMHYIVSFVLALVGVVVFAAILGIAAVFPFAYDKLGEIMNNLLAKQSELHEKRKPALEAAKEKKAALKKEQAQLNKDKKKLEKAKKKAMDKKVKRIYEERMANGYEASLDMIDAEVEKAEKASKKAAKKASKSKKSETAPAVVSAPVAEPAAVDFVSSADDAGSDYTANGSMFRGLSF